MEKVPRKIRLRYAGLINFIANIISIFTGLIFVILVSRKLPEEQFGLWHYLGVIVQYYVIPATLINYWIIRYAGRGFKVARTGISLNSLLMIISETIFLISAPMLIYAVPTNVNLNLIIIALALQLLSGYYLGTLIALAGGVAPQAIGYGLLIQEITKIIIGYYLVRILQLNLFGAIMSYTISRYLYALFLTIYLKEEFSEKINKNLAIKWIKLSWLPAYSFIPGYLRNLDVVLITFTYSSLPVAHMKAIQTIATTIAYSERLHAPLYAKLLSGGSSKDIEIALSYFLLFAIPMMAGISAMSKTYLSLLKKSYTISADALIIATIYTLTFSLMLLFMRVLMGIEKIEIKEKISIKEYLKSNLFYTPTIRIINYTLYLVTLYITLKIIMPLKIETTTIVLIWITIKTIFISIILIIFYYKCKKLMRFKIPKIKIAKYILASIIMAAILVISKIGQKVTTSFMEALKFSIIGTAIGAATYLIILLIIEPEVKELIKTTLIEIKTILKIKRK